MEIVIRASVMYLAVFLLLRLMGKRELAQLTPFDLVLLIVIGDLIQQGVTQQDFSLTGATLAICTIAAWSLGLSALSHRFDSARRLLEGVPVVLVRDGRLIEANLDRERVDFDELSSEMRIAGIPGIDRIAWAILEPQGKISFIRKDEDPPNEESQQAPV